MCHTDYLSTLNFVSFFKDLIQNQLSFLPPRIFVAPDVSDNGQSSFDFLLHFYRPSSSPRRPFSSHSLICSENHLFILRIGPIFDKELYFFLNRSIWSYVCFMVGNSTIRYICDTHHLNIICIISYFKIIPFFSIIYVTTYMIFF